MVVDGPGLPGPRPCTSSSRLIPPQLAGSPKRRHQDQGLNGWATPPWGYVGPRRTLKMADAAKMVWGSAAPKPMLSLIVAIGLARRNALRRTLGLSRTSVPGGHTEILQKCAPQSGAYPIGPDPPLLILSTPLLESCVAMKSALAAHRAPTKSEIRCLAHSRLIHAEM